jgi:hypothetical protein
MISQEIIAKPLRLNLRRAHIMRYPWTVFLLALKPARLASAPWKLLDGFDSTAQMSFRPPLYVIP